jgi:DNA-binding response OmpR family regulator
MKVLIVEDDPAVSHFLAKGFEELGWSTQVCHNGKGATELLSVWSFDVIILDLLLPGMPGLEVLKDLRDAGGTTPVVILTALDDTEDVVRGLNMGADDYLVKPFSFNELHARIHAILRRGQPLSPSILRVADLVLDPIKRRVSRDGASIELTPKEFTLLEYLMRHPGQILTRVMILEQVWGYDFDTMTNLVDVHVYKLRNKLDRGFRQTLIKTIKGVGYVLEA